MNIKPFTVLWNIFLLFYYFCPILTFWAELGEGDTDSHILEKSETCDYASRAYDVTHIDDVTIMISLFNP